MIKHYIKNEACFNWRFFVSYRHFNILALPKVISNHMKILLLHIDDLSAV